MNQAGPIIVLEDDDDDQLLMHEVFKTIGVKQEVKFFNSSDDALTFLLETKVQPFVIISDINMPGLNGIAFKAKLASIESLVEKSIPFVFFTTTASKRTVQEAFDLKVQGFFVKPATLSEMETRLRVIIDYWTHSLHPNLM